MEGHRDAVPQDEVAELDRLRGALRRVAAALPAPEALHDPAAARIADRLRERIARDLLPRLGEQRPVLLVGIAGPNNVGKSSLFNALIGHPVSPAMPEGGLTRQCIAAVAPSNWTDELRAFVGQRYEVVEIGEGESAPVTESGPRGRLFIVRVPGAPEGVLLMDTPDFDSIYRTNRENAEALLVTVDLVLFVVSRQTYQNAALVEFLRDVVGHGRPYALVYNEAARPEIAREHLAKLSADVGFPPVAGYFALHQPEVESGSRFLETQPAPSAGFDGETPPLRSLLTEPEHAAELKARALGASLTDARRELAMVLDAIEEELAGPERLLKRLHRELVRAGERAASQAIPADVLIEALRDELDARSPVHRMLRAVPRFISSTLIRVGRAIRESFTGPEIVAIPVDRRVEDEARDGVREAVESMAPEVRAWRGDERTRELLEQAFGPATLSKLDGPLGIEALGTGTDRRALYDFCRELLGREVSDRDIGEFLQVMMTVGYVLPAAVGAVGAVVFPGVTGGWDVVWASTLVTTPILEQIVDKLGENLREQVARRWARTRGETIANQLEALIFSPLIDHLHGQSRRLREAADALGQESLELGTAPQEEG